MNRFLALVMLLLCALFPLASAAALLPTEPAAPIEMVTPSEMATPTVFATAMEANETTLLDAHQAEVVDFIRLYEHPLYRGRYFFIHSGMPSNVCYDLPDDAGISSIYFYTPKDPWFSCYIYLGKGCTGTMGKVVSTVLDLWWFSRTWNNNIRSFKCEW